MSSLEDLITDALTSTDNDSALARALVDSGALAEIIRRGTYNEDSVQKRLNYASSSALRAALSKARRNKSRFPLPVTEGRRWSRTDVDTFRRTRRTPTNSTASRTPKTSTTPDTSTGTTAPVTSTIPTTANNSTAPGGSTSSSGTLASGTGGGPFVGDHRRDPDQWRNHQ